MAEIKVTPETLKQYSSNFRTLNNNFMSLMERIESDMTSMKSKWEGQAADSFINKFNSLKQSFPNYKNAFDQYANYLQKAGDDYDYSENVVKSNSEGLATSASASRF